MKVSFKIAPMQSINSDNTENNSIDSNDRSLIYEHIPPASLHPFPGHRSIASSGKGNLNSEYYYPMSEIRQASEQDIQNLSELQRADSSIFRRDSHHNTNDRGLNNGRQKQSVTKASPSIMHSTASTFSVKISFISSIVLHLLVPVITVTMVIKPMY